MKKPAKMKKAPRRQSVALAQASPSMLDEHPGALSKQVAVSCDATPASATIGGTTPQAALKMKKPNKMKKPPRRASLMPGQLPTESADFKPSLAPIAASGLPAGVPEDALGPMPAKPAPKPKGGNLKGKGAKRNSVANLGACSFTRCLAVVLKPPFFVYAKLAWWCPFSHRCGPGHAGCDGGGWYRRGRRGRGA
jgi:hypothetical protein